jgi:hydrogenase maturation HypF-like protein
MGPASEMMGRFGAGNSLSEALQRGWSVWRIYAPLRCRAATPRRHFRCRLLPGSSDLEDIADLTLAPFLLPVRYRQARLLVARGVRTFVTTSVGRLFDAVAALLGFSGDVTFEAQAAIWLEHRASCATDCAPVPFEYGDGQIDWRPAIRSVIERRLAGEDVPAIALGFHRGFAEVSARAAMKLCDQHQADTVVLSGGVFHNQLLLRFLHESFEDHGLPASRVWTNQIVPTGDGGLSLGQAAIASLSSVLSERCPRNTEEFGIRQARELFAPHALDAQRPVPYIRCRYPALILSPRAYNRRARLAIACPITSQSKAIRSKCFCLQGARLEGMFSPTT